MAANLLEHGTGALNIDGCRIGFSGKEPYDIDAKCRPNSRGPSVSKVGPSGGDVNVSALGRWPANVVLDPEAAAMLDEQSGDRPGMPITTRRKGESGKGYGLGVMPDPTSGGYGDSGGASRFFYTAKTSRAERNAGLDSFATKPLNWSSGEDSPGTFQGDGTRREARNHHPTVKPIDLMRWLVRLVTPPGGTVLDPFSGSGSTGCAAVLEGFDFVGCEREPEYVAIAEARISFWAERVGREVDDVLAVAGASERERKRHDEMGQGSIFDFELSEVAP